MLVEPHLPVRELITAYLDGRGMEVTSVDSASAARVAWAGLPHDVVVTETALPDAEGADVLRQVGEGCGRLAIAASLSVPETILTMQAGAEAVLLKPLRLRELYDAIRGAAQRARGRERERLARDLFLGASRCGTMAEASALRAILDAEADLLAGDPALRTACTRVVHMAEQQCR